MGDCNPRHEYPVCQMGRLITAKTAAVSDGRLIMARTGPCMSDWTVIMATTVHVSQREECNHRQNSPCITDWTVITVTLFTIC